MAGLYIHIPFCKSRCIYCDFYSTTGNESLHDRYTDALHKELEIRKDFLHDDVIGTAYIGGGTPSTLSPHHLMQLAALVPPTVREFTVECNPDDVTSDMARTLQDMGVNRISMGAQTFSDARLGMLERRHNSRQIREAVQILRQHGFTNISIDLIYGFPGETVEEWEHDIDEALALNTEHLSAYSLMYEEGTQLTRMANSGEIVRLDDDTCCKMYDTLVNKLTMAGYEHYEISNFARPGYHSQHNSSYWNGTEYIGIGAAAHSYNTVSRQWNVNDVRQYIESIERGVVPMERELLDDITRYNDMVTTALRTAVGIDLDALEPRFRDYAMANARRNISAGLLQITDRHMRLTRKGMFVNDEVMSDLIWA